MPDTPRNLAKSGAGDEHITRALRLTSVEIRQVADRLGLTPYQVRAVLIAAGAMGDVIPPPQACFVVEEGEYEQRGIVLVASSFDAAADAVKTRYRAPYRVKWKTHEDGLEGRFEAVPRYSTAHTAFYSITPFALERGVVLPVPPETK